MNLPIADRYRRLPPKERARLRAEIEGDPELGPGALYDLHHAWEDVWLRPYQIVTDRDLNPEDDDPPGLIIFTGQRGDGKTQSAVTLFDRLIKEGKAEKPRIFAATDADVEKYVIKGESGIFTLYDKSDPERPSWHKNAGFCGELRYPNGVIVDCFSAAAPEQATAGNGDLDLYDDPAKWGANTRTVWTHARASCRIGIGLAITATTKRGTELLKNLLKGGMKGVILRRPPALDANRFNLKKGYKEQAIRELGEHDDLVRQELFDEDIVSGAPFTDLDFDSHPIRIVECARAELREVVIAVDPAEHNGTSHDEWGIGAAGKRHDGHFIALEDQSDVLGEEEAGDRIIALCEHWGAWKIIVETNRSKAVTSTIRAAYYKRRLEAMEAGETPPPMPEIIPVHVKQGKTIRAGHVRPLYIQGVVHHLPGLHKLEKQQRNWNPNGPRRPRQDDRIDWLVHALTHLARLAGKVPVSIDQVKGLAERSQRISRQQAVQREGATLMMGGDAVRTIENTRRAGRRPGRHSMGKKKLRI